MKFVLMHDKKQIKNFIYLSICVYQHTIPALSSPQLSLNKDWCSRRSVSFPRTSLLHRCNYSYLLQENVVAVLVTQNLWVDAPRDYASFIAVVQLNFR
jgi:hypothetical protein